MRDPWVLARSCNKMDDAQATSLGTTLATLTSLGKLLLGCGKRVDLQ